MNISPGQYIDLSIGSCCRSIAGYDWLTSDNELGPVRLIQKDASHVYYDPFSIPTLFFQFAELNPDDPDSLLGFANQYGTLVTSISNISFLHYAISIPPEETLEFWQTQVNNMKALVNLWKWYKTDNLAMLSEVISCGTPQKLYSVNGVELNAQVLDYFYSFNGGEEPELFFTQRTQGRIITKDIKASVPSLISVIVMKELGAWPVHPYLLPTPQGELVQRFVPSSLLSTMWFQVFQAVSGEKKFKRCVVCQKWEDVTDKKATWKSHPECSSRERVRRYRDKQSEVNKKLP